MKFLLLSIPNCLEGAIIGVGGISPLISEALQAEMPNHLGGES